MSVPATDASSIPHVHVESVGIRNGYRFRTSSNLFGSHAGCLRFTQQWVCISEYLHNWVWRPVRVSYLGCRPWRKLGQPVRDLEQHAARLKAVCEIVHDAGCLLDQYTHGINFYVQAGACELAFESRSSLTEEMRMLAFDHVLRAVDRLLSIAASKSA